MSKLPVIFADALQGATVQNNVVRMQLSEVGADGTLAPCGHVMVPLNAFGTFAANVNALLQQMEERLREAQAAQPAAGGTA